ncbi:MAG: ATP-binding cassette domain-containing protein [Thiotrichaceae bacterium]|nr:ATP-binding cassette domain-containing protein [Thiotrichaceae bacterium]
MLIAQSLKIQRGESIILNRCSFSLKEGSFTYLAGASGVGKSTLLWTLARMYPLIAGELWFQGKSQNEIMVNRWRTNIALLPQSPIILPGTVADNLLYPLQTFRIQKERYEFLPKTEKLHKELDTVGLGDIPLEREAASLSGGQQSRIALIRLILTQPKIILADEPTTGVDQATSKLVLNRLHRFCEEGGAVLITSHVHAELMQCTHIILNGNAGLSIKTCLSTSVG